MFSRKCIVCILALFVSYVCSQQAAYMAQRDSLVEAEYEESLSGKVVLSAQELIADAILANLLVKEAGIMGDNFPPSMNFFKAHDWILNTSILFPLVQQMPKGVVHHLHIDSSATYDWLIKNATYSPFCYIYEGPATAESVPGTLQVFKTPPSSAWANVNANRAKSGNPTAFDEALLLSLSMQNEDFGDYVHLWDKFDNIFARLELIKDKDTFEGYVQHMVTEMLADNVQNIEVKIAPETVLFDLEGNTYDFDYVISYMYELINATRLIEPQFTMKLVMSDVRSKNYTSILSLLELSLKYRNLHPDLVVGFDLVGPEDEGHTLLYFIEDFLAIANISRDYTYGLPYYFHAGETLMANNTNLFDAILLGCFRIGHAFQLAKHPILMEMVIEQNIGLEICPISNQILGYCSDLRGHPAFDYFDSGAPMTISPDDPAIYGYGGVSFDWYEILLAWSIDIAGLKQLALNSYLKGSFSSPKQQLETATAWMIKWDAWVNWVVATYPQ